METPIETTSDLITLRTIFRLPYRDGRRLNSLDNFRVTSSMDFEVIKRKRSSADYTKKIRLLRKKKIIQVSPETSCEILKRFSSDEHLPK